MKLTLDRFIFPVVMAAFMAFAMTAFVTLINVGFTADYFLRWMKAFALAWPLAAVVAFFAAPLAHKITQRILSFWR